MKILVTGGAGYIGSHVLKILGKSNHEIVILDNLSSGFRESVLCGDLIVEDLQNHDSIDKIIHNGNFDAIIHFAAFIEVEESVRNPLKYYKNNTVNTIYLIDLCVKYGIKYFIFSSTAAVYGNPETVPVNENYNTSPLNPYGHSKLFIERILRDVANVSNIKYGILRYFNVAGADKDLEIGQRTPHATHLIKVACQAALGVRDGISIYGTDYDTKDGTGVRDYIHVDDLANAHIKTLEYLTDNDSEIFNCGYGYGYSVREVIAAVKRTSGVDFKVEETKKRPGDASVLIADNSKILSKTKWTPIFNDLDYICHTAFEWERKIWHGKS